MVKDAEKLAAFEKVYQQQTPPDHAHSLRIYEALYQHACVLGIFPLKNPLDGLDHKINLAHALHVHAPAPKTR